MRILLLFHHFRGLHERGGLRSRQIATYLARAGHRVTVVVPGIDPLTERRDPSLKGRLFARVRDDGVEVIRVNSFSNRRASKLSRACYFVSSSAMQFFRALTLGRPDVIVCTSIPPTQMILSYLLSRIRRVPLLIDVRDLALDYAIGLGYLRKNLPVRIAMSIERYVLRRAECVATISEGIRNMILAKGADRRRVHFIPIGYASELYDEGIDWSRDVREEYGFDDSFLAVYAGTMSNLVDVRTLLDAAKYTRGRPDITWVFAGAGEKLEEYRKYASEHRLNCIFTGEVPKSDVVLISKEAGVCLYALGGHPLFGTFLGNKVFDYLGAGAPMIFCGPDGDISNIVKESKAGWCLPPGDSKGMAKLVVSLADSGGGSDYGKRGRQFIYERFSSSGSVMKIGRLITALNDNRYGA